MTRLILVLGLIASGSLFAADVEFLMQLSPGVKWCYKTGLPEPLDSLCTEAGPSDQLKDDVEIGLTEVTTPYTEKEYRGYDISTIVDGDYTFDFRVDIYSTYSSAKDDELYEVILTVITSRGLEVLGTTKSKNFVWSEDMLDGIMSEIEGTSVENGKGTTFLPVFSTAPYGS